MTKRRPNILITLSNANDENLASIVGDTKIVYSDQATAVAVIDAGGTPLYMPSGADPGLYIELADGVLLTGADTNTNPVYYGEASEGFDGRIDDCRDQLDIALVKLAYEKRLPLLGICKGMQVMNVALGGTLFQDVTVQKPSQVSHNNAGRRFEATHSARIAKHTLLSELFEAKNILLKGGHQQAVKNLGPGLVPAAIADDGIVEAYESKEHPFLLGIQFHAELRLDEKPFNNIFGALITAATKSQRR